MNRRSKIMRTVIGVFCGLLVGVSALFAHADTLVRVGTYQDHAAAIRTYLANNGCQSLADADIDENQILAEFLIFCNAIKSGNADYHFEIYPYPLNARILDDLERGFLDASAIGIWRNELRGDHYVASVPLLRRNQFVKGFYTTKERLSELRDSGSLDDKIALANSNWYLDWAMLTCSGLKPVHVDQYKNMFRMLNAGRGDVIPLTFSNRPDLERKHFNVPLYPVPGYKMIFDDSTHYALSTHTEKREKLKQALNNGLTQLHERNAIEDVYRRLGIINKAVDDWQPVGRCQSSL